MDQKTQITIVFAAGAFFALVVVVVAIIMLRRRFLRPSEQKPVNPFTLDGLQKMHEFGQISDEEYKKLRSKIIENM